MIEMGKRIRAMRQSKHYTLDEVSAKLKIPKSTLSKLENGKLLRIDRHYIDKLARLFECDAAYLMGYEDTPNVDLIYSAPGKEDILVTVDERPVIGHISKMAELYSALLALRPENYDVALKILKSLQ